MRLFVLLLFFFLPVFLFAQDSLYEEIAKKETTLKSVKNDSVKSELFFELYKEYQFIDSPKAFFYLNNFHDLAIKRKDTSALINYYYYLCVHFFYGKNYAETERLARICMKLSRGRAPFYYLEVGQILMKSLHFRGALREAVDIGKTILASDTYSDNSVQVAKIYFNLGLVTMNLSEEEDSSVHYLYSAIPYLIQNPDNKVLMPCYYNISVYYRDKNQIDSAIKYGTMAVELAKNYTRYDIADFILPANNLVLLLNQVGRKKEAEELSSELMKQQYELKIKSITYPQVSARINYLEHLRLQQKFRFIVLLVVLISILVILSFTLFYYKKLKQKEKLLQESLHSNQVLAKENNHRVKNNYQMIMSMMNMNAGNDDSGHIQFVEQMQARIASMARVHEMFIENTLGKQIDTETFLSEVVASLESSLSLQQKNINMQFHSVGYELPSSKIITLGLIINELVVNTVKYAFAGRESGEIKISLEKVDDEFILLFSDNGIGIDQQKNISEGSGMSIIYSLAKQLRGEAKIMNDGGARVEVRFKS